MPPRMSSNVANPVNAAKATWPGNPASQSPSQAKAQPQPNVAPQCRQCRQSNVANVATGECRQGDVANVAKALNSSRRRAEVSSSTQSDYVVFRGGVCYGTIYPPLVPAPTTGKNKPQLKMGLWLQVFASFLLRAHRKNKHFSITRLGFGSARKWGPSRAPDSAARPNAEHFLNKCSRLTIVELKLSYCLRVNSSGVFGLEWMPQEQKNVGFWRNIRLLGNSSVRCCGGE